jgi:hypothetical protein
MQLHSIFLLYFCSVKNMKTKYILFLQVLLAGLFISYWVSSTLLTHSHIVDNQVVSHSHPFSSQHHSHSQTDWIWNIHHHSMPIVLVALVSLFFIFTIRFKNSRVHFSLHLLSHTLENRHRRPPPIS